jgi:hypothetical protein
MCGIAAWSQANGLRRAGGWREAGAVYNRDLIVNIYIYR